MQSHSRLQVTAWVSGHGSVLVYARCQPSHMPPGMLCSMHSGAQSSDAHAIQAG